MITKKNIEMISFSFRLKVIYRYIHTNIYILNHKYLLNVNSYYIYF